MWQIAAVMVGGAATVMMTSLAYLFKHYGKELVILKYAFLGLAIIANLITAHVVLGIGLSSEVGLIKVGSYALWFFSLAFLLGSGYVMLRGVPEIVERFRAWKRGF